jgi:hypothetical protein
MCGKVAEDILPRSRNTFRLNAICGSASASLAAT